MRARMRRCLAKVGMSGKSFLPDVEEMRVCHGRTGKIRQRLQPVSAAVLQRAADLVRQPAPASEGLPPAPCGRRNAGSPCRGNMAAAV